MTATEIPVAFTCEGSWLAGIVHRPEKPRRRGVLAIVAGGPQYRAGCCRQLVQAARSLAALGTPVMRFDYRGLGDSDGENRGFQHIAADIEAAIAAFVQHADGLEEVVLWGGCDAASAAMLHGPGSPRVTGMILGNPFVHSEETHAKVVVRHYYWRRIREKAFWQKVLRMQLNPLKVAASVISAVRLATGGAARRGSATPGAPLPFPERMRRSMDGYTGHVLLMMSGLSLVSKEFDELVAASPEWQRVMQGLDLTRVDFPEADQAFSTVAARQGQIAAATRWLDDWAASDD